MPETMSFEEGAALTTIYGTSYHALKDRAALKEGETVLVLGAAGGVGIAAVQLAKAMGAKVIAAASTAEKLAFAKENGADETVNYSEEDLKARVKELTEGKGVDVVYDPVGGRSGRSRAARIRLGVALSGGRLRLRSDPENPAQSGAAQQPQHSRRLLGRLGGPQSAGERPEHQRAVRLLRRRQDQAASQRRL
jgi:D-arabinose 1-dehydrogenase-like Zn-dependent alcohol dehydrogenase